MAAKVRVHELARELLLTNKECLDICLALGIRVLTHSSGVEEAQADRVRRWVERDDMTRDQRFPAVQEEGASRRVETDGVTRRAQRNRARQPADPGVSSYPYTPTEVAADDADANCADSAARTVVSVEAGDIVMGTVVGVNHDEVLVDIGHGSVGVIPGRELSVGNAVNPWEVVDIGERVEVLVLQKRDLDRRLILSRKRARYERAWGDIERIMEEDGVVAGPVIEVVKGGLVLDIGVRGFLPVSLVEVRRVGDHDLWSYLGKVLEGKVIQADKHRNNVVVSRRAWLKETQREKREDFLASLKPGEVRKGVVTSVANFGAFVDLGGMDGLIHVSELTWKPIDHTRSVIAVGDEVEVQVLDVDLDRERISLSRKATQQRPNAPEPVSLEDDRTALRRATRLHNRDQLLATWNAVLLHIPGLKGPTAIAALSRKTRLSHDDLDHARRVRNQIAHPDANHVTDADLHRALSVAHRALERLGSPDGP